MGAHLLEIYSSYSVGECRSHDFATWRRGSTCAKRWWRGRELVGVALVFRAVLRARPRQHCGGGSVLCFLARAPSWDCGARLAWSMARFPDERSRMTTPVGFARLEHIASTVLRDALHSPTWCLVPLPPRSYRMWETLPPRWMRHGFRFSRPIRSSLRKRTRPQAPRRGRRETSRKPRRMPLERRRIERVEMQGVVWIKADGGEVHLPWRTHPSGFRVLPDWATPLTCTTRVIG